MQFLANALTCLTVLTLLCVPADAGVRAPAFTFTSSFTLILQGPAHNATLTLDTGQTASLANLDGSGPLSIHGVPDGLRSWRLTYNDTTRAQAVVGEFTAQDLTPLIAHEVERAVDSGQNATAEAGAAHAASVATLNVTLAEAVVLNRTLAAVQAIHPEDLARRGDLAELAQQEAAQLQAMTTLFQRVSENQTRALQESRHELSSLRGTASFLAGLLLLALGILAAYLARLRSQLKTLPQMPPPPSRHSKPATSTPLAAPSPPAPPPPPTKQRRGRSPDGGGTDAK